MTREEWEGQALKVGLCYWGCESPSEYLELKSSGSCKLMEAVAGDLGMVTGCSTTYDNDILFNTFK